MAKLYPPLISNIVPSFELKGAETKISVPFFLNRLTGINEVKGFKIKVKTIQSNDEIINNELDITLHNNKGTLVFPLIEAEVKNLTMGDFYKLQIANYDSSTKTNLYFSDLAIVKATGQITSEIYNLSAESINLAPQELIGIYKNTDVTEKLYSSQFIIYDENMNVFEDSGELIQNSENQASYLRKRDFIQGKTYFVKWIYTTVNSLIQETPLYRIAQFNVQPQADLSIKVETNIEEGYANLDLIGKEVVSGNFILSRSSSKEPDVWNKIFSFSLNEEIPNRHLWRDNTLEEGVTYTYAIQQYNKYNVFTSRILSEPVCIQFEHMYLSDRERQLKIKFNPKISSFKPNILESKTDTINGKYPFIFRNGNVYYHELPLSGLISLQMDENHLFIGGQNEEELTRKKTKAVQDINPERDIIYQEREFKREVLSWLTDGKPKLLRTPTEGNFIVRLMNVSLSPLDQLGRMLHTFSATAYEIEDFSFSSVVNLDLLQDTEDHDKINLVYKTIELTGQKETSIENVYYIQIDNAKPGMKITIDDEQEIIVGPVGNYKVDFDEPKTISFERQEVGFVTVGVLGDSKKSEFDTLKNIKVNYVYSEDIYFANNKRLLEEFYNSFYYNPDNKEHDIFNQEYYSIVDNYSTVKGNRILQYFEGINTLKQLLDKILYPYVEAGQNRLKILFKEFMKKSTLVENKDEYNIFEDLFPKNQNIQTIAIYFLRFSKVNNEGPHKVRFEYKDGTNTEINLFDKDEYVIKDIEVSDLSAIYISNDLMVNISYEMIEEVKEK